MTTPDGLLSRECPCCAGAGVMALAMCAWCAGSGVIDPETYLLFREREQAARREDTAAARTVGAAVAEAAGLL